MGSRRFNHKRFLLGSSLVLAFGSALPFLFQLVGMSMFSFLPITITGQENIRIHYREAYEITLDDLEIDYDGNKGDIQISILPGEGYDIGPGTTITPNVSYTSSWPAAGITIEVRLQLSDGADQSDEFGLNILVIPPILALSYTESSCQGSISMTASAYKPTGTSVVSFPFIFQLFDSEGNLFEERQVNYGSPFDNSATAVFGVNMANPLDRNESYRLVVTDNLGRTYKRNSGPIGEAYSLDIEMNFSGFVCSNDNIGVAEFVISNAALPLNELIIVDENGNEMISEFTVWEQEGTNMVLVQVQNLQAGRYTAHIQDRITCRGSRAFNIVIPSPLTFEEELTHVSCPENHDGSISLEISGGWSQHFAGNLRENWSFYDIIWYDQAGNSIGTGTSRFVQDGSGNIISVINEMSGLTTGFYYAQIFDRGRVFEFDNSDPLECVVQTPLFEIEGPEPLYLNSTLSSISCHGANDGRIEISPTGGSPSYQIVWYRGSFDDLSNPDITQATALPNPPNPNVLEDLNSGEYAIILTDENGCRIAENFVIEEPNELVISEDPDDRVHIQCFGESAGAFTISIDQASVGPFLVQAQLPGGEPGSSGEISTNGDAPVSFTNMPAGVYTVIVTDANGCYQEIDDIEITQPEDGLRIESFTASDYNGFQISCEGENDGSISVEVIGGIGELIYSWTGPDGYEASMPDIEGLYPGTYVFTVTDENGCSAVTEEIEILAPPPLTILSETSHISCHGAEDGSVAIEINGGTGDYTITWTGPDGFTSNSPSIDNLHPGTYQVTLVDGNGCILEETYQVTEPDPLEIEEDESLRQNILCMGQETGQIHVLLTSLSVGPFLLELGVSGSTDPEISLPNFSETEHSFAGLVAGTYWVTVTDGNGCTKMVDNITLTEPSEALEITNLNISDYNGYEVSCFGAEDGNISFTVQGNQGNVSYEWELPDGTTSDSPNLSGIGAGEYHLTITDENGCELTQTFLLREPEEFVLGDEVSDYNGFQIRCEGGTDGFIRLSPSGGTSTYQFHWIGPDGFSSIEQNLEDIPAGTYVVTVTDENGCEIVRSFEITEPENLVVEELADQRVDVLCFGESTGEIHVSITQISAAPYNYYIQPAGGDLGSSGSVESLNETSHTFGNLPAGVYEVTVIDANGCTETIGDLEIRQPDFGISIIDINVEHYGDFQISCYGAEDGQIAVMLEGGTGNYEFEWTGPDDFTANTAEISNLGPGSYKLTVIDENGCSVETDEIIISEPDPLTFNESVSDFNGYFISCFGSNDGFIDLNPTGGSGEYTITWAGPDGFTSNSPSIDNLHPGTYQVTLMDGNGCILEETYQVTEPALLEASVTGTVDVLCFGEATGAISLQVSGGASSAYTYQWYRNGNLIQESQQNPAMLLAGNYTVIVSDENQCSVTIEDIVITQPPLPLIVELEWTEVSCYNSNDGTVSSEISGGVAPYQISWNFGSTQPNLTGLAPGQYEITVTDANGCTVTESVTIPDVPVFDIEPDVQHVSCFGANDASINLNLIGGVTPVRAIWDHGPEQAALYSLEPGDYGVTIVDGSGCEIRSVFHITEPDILIVTGIVEDALLCDDGQSGSINLVVSGGRPPFRYVWSNGADTPNLTNLSSGQYSVEVYDESGCYASTRFQVRRPQPFQVSTVHYQETNCEPREILDIFEINVDGGVAPYSIQWSSGDVSDNGYRMATDEPGLYTLQITDAEGCVYTESFEVENSRVLVEGEYWSQSFLDYQAHLINMDIEFINNSSGNILTYYWDFGDGNASMEEAPIHRYQEEGTYQITLRAVDIYGCEYVRNMEITVFDHFLVVPNIFSPNRDGLNDYFFPKFLQVATINDFRIMNKWGEIVFHTDDLESPGWDGTLNGEDAIPGNYVYRINYTTVDGRSFTKTGVFLLVR